MSTGDELVGVLRDLLRAGQAEPHTVLLLTDEELAAVTTPDAAGPSPWLDRLTGVPREVAAQFGGRSLLTRGLIRAAPGVGSPEDPNLEAAMELRVVDTRLIGLGYVRADRGTADDGWRSSPLASSARCWGGWPGRTPPHRRSAKRRRAPTARPPSS